MDDPALLQRVDELGQRLAAEAEARFDQGQAAATEGRWAPAAKA